MGRQWGSGSYSLQKATWVCVLNSSILSSLPCLNNGQSTTTPPHTPPRTARILKAQRRRAGGTCSFSLLYHTTTPLYLLTTCRHKTFFLALLPPPRTFALLCAIFRVKLKPYCAPSSSLTLPLPHTDRHSQKGGFSLSVGGE